MPFFQSISEAYFRSREFEKRGRIYRKAGVHLASKFFGSPTVAGTPIPNPFHNPLGEAKSIKGVLKNKAYSPSWARKKEYLESAEKRTRWLEAGHLAVTSIGVAAMFSSPVIGGAFILGNVYMALVQRYNRARIYSILEQLEKKK